eukprot:CAMPEP_0117666670 /NCGR_PEP_ID=MMETSP0804-20121206/10512_1 /TAXON_ID=1074897 /ORGANISM="Tetraselmis astigmatica, Strain CCMP880" /LENGTH=135 /DNA_ID=CAMNT_0005474255 /DNA_START=724 /DNA_END=1131 /DNA_ORIENTATION=-
MGRSLSWMAFSSSSPVILTTREALVVLSSVASASALQRRPERRLESAVLLERRRARLLLLPLRPRAARGTPEDGRSAADEAQERGPRLLTAAAAAVPCGRLALVAVREQGLRELDNGLVAISKNWGLEVGKGAEG